MEVFSFGNGDFLFQIFTAIVGIMGDGSYTTLMRIAILFGFLFMAYQLMFSLNIVHISRSVVSYIAFFFIIHGLFYIPKTNVIIRDEIKNTQVTVNNVPYGVGMFANLFTTLEKGLTNLMENYFSTPTDMRFNKSGYAFSVMLLDSFKDVVPTNPYFSQSLNDFIRDCFFHDVLWGDKDLEQVVNVNNVWSMMNPSHSANIYTKVYNQANPAGQSVLCSSAYSTISGNLGTMSGEALTAMNKILQIDIAAKSPAVLNQLLGVGMGAADAIQQAMISNALKSSFAQTAMYVGSGSGAIPYASGLAEQTQRTSWTVAGELSKKYIPIMRQVLEAFVYGLFPIMFVLMLTPMGGKYIQTYLTLLFWLLLWSPLFAIINLIVNTRAEGVLSAAYGKFSIGSMPFIYQSASELTAMAGYMAWMVPTVAFALAKGSEHAVTSLASSVASSASFPAKSAGEEASGIAAADRIASFAATAAAQQIHGTEAMYGMAANKIFSIQQGMEMGSSGLGAMRNVAGTEWSARNIDAQQIGQVAGQHGMTVGQAQTLMASDKYQQALTSAGARKSFAEDFAKQHNTTTEAGYQFLADTHMAGNRAINQVWNGNAQGYAAYLATGHEIGLGGQQGLIQAAKEMGVNVGDFAQMKSFMENAKASGAMRLLQEGKITGDDLRQMGRMGLLSEKGMAEAAQRIADATGMSYDQAKAYIGTREGLNEYAKFKALDTAMEKTLGMPVTDKNALEFAMGRHASVSTTLTGAQAEALTKNMQAQGYKNFQAQAGDRVTFAFDPETGKVSMALADRGGKVSQFDVSSVDEGLRKRIGDDIKTGDDIQRVDINKDVVDKGKRHRVGDDITIGDDIQRVDINKDVVDKGKRHRVGDDITIGNDIQRVDINKDVVDKGKRHRVGDDITTGDKIEDLDINRSVVDRGTQIGGTALQMALKADPSLYKGVVSAYESNDLAKTQAEISQTSSKIMEGLAPYVSTQGTNAHKALGEAYLELGVSTPSISPYQAKMGGRGSVGVSSEQSTNFNLLTKALDDVQTKFLKEGERLGLKGRALQSHIAAKTGQFVQAWKNYATSDQKFGYEKPSELIYQAAGSGAPLPMQPEGEQKRRGEIIRQEIQRKVQENLRSKRQ